MISERFNKAIRAYEDNIPPIAQTRLINDELPPVGMDSDGIVEHESRRDRDIQPHPRAASTEAARMPSPPAEEVESLDVVAEVLQQESHPSDTATITSVSTASFVISMFGEDDISHNHPPMSARARPTCSTTLSDVDVNTTPSISTQSDCAVAQKSAQESLGFADESAVETGTKYKSHKVLLAGLYDKNNQVFEKRSRSSVNSVCSHEPPTQRPRRGGSIKGDNVGAGDSTIDEKTDDFADAGEESESQVAMMCESIASISVDGTGTRSFKSKGRRQQATPEKGLFATSNKSTTQPRPTMSVPRLGIGPIANPHRNDVLCEGHIIDLFDNVQFRKVMVAHKKEYLFKTTTIERVRIAVRIVELIRAKDPQGRFLEIDGDTGLWFDIGDIEAISRTGQALRRALAGDASSTTNYSETVVALDQLLRIFNRTEISSVSSISGSSKQSSNVTNMSQSMAAASLSSDGISHP